jgi:triacylglycerol lipase
MNTKRRGTGGNGNSGEALVAALSSSPDHLPVLLVHGYGGHKSQWYRVEQTLAAAGFRHVRTFEYDSVGNSIATIADQLTTAVQRLLEETGAPEVHLVGHSLGGVIIRYAISVSGLDPLVRTAVTVASPHGGCRLAQFGLGPAAAQLRPGSFTLRKLEAVARAHHARWVAFYSAADLVVPARRARIRPPVMNATNVALPGESHLSILQSGRLTTALIEQLRHSEATVSAAA